ncbi:hypothetical protein C7296_29790, partial [Burkholderia thailandensis]|nr:hypothetical protein [Burkholderia thailandensis]
AGASARRLDRQCGRFAAADAQARDAARRAALAQHAERRGDNARATEGITIESTGVTRSMRAGLAIWHLHAYAYIMIECDADAGIACLSRASAGRSGEHDVRVSRVARCAGRCRVARKETPRVQRGRVAAS